MCVCVCVCNLVVCLVVHVSKDSHNGRIHVTVGNATQQDNHRRRRRYVNTGVERSATSCMELVANASRIYNFS